MTHQIALHHFKVGFGGFWNTIHLFLNLMILIPMAVFGYVLAHRLALAQEASALASLMLAIGQLGMATIAVRGVRGRVRLPSGESTAGEALPSLPVRPFTRHVTDAVAAMCSVAVLCVPLVLFFALSDKGFALDWLFRFYIGLAPPMLLVALMMTDRGFHQLVALILCVALPHTALTLLGLEWSLPAVIAASALSCGLIVALWHSGAIDAYLKLFKFEPGTWSGPLHEPPRPPLSHWRRQIWRYRARDIWPIVLLGAFIWSINAIPDMFEPDFSPQIHLLQLVANALALAGIMVPVARHNFPISATAGGGVRTRLVVESYRVLPLPRWRIYRGLFAQAAFTFCLFAALCGLVWWLGHTLYGDAFETPTYVMYFPGLFILWPALFAQGEGWRWRRLLIYSLGGVGLVLYTHSSLAFARKGIVPEGWVVALIAVCYAVPFLICARALFPPGRRAGFVNP